MNTSKLRSTLKSAFNEIEDAIRSIEEIIENIPEDNHDLPHITRRHIITLRDAIEAFGGTNSERADLAEVLRCVEAIG